MEQHPQAYCIVELLTKKGFVAYYAGGWVRDFLLNHPSDDIDIATSASPEVIQSLFPKTIPIGIAFGVVLILMDGRQYEVATFREEADYKDGRRPSTMNFSTATPITDAHRRDFTINGMFFDPLTETVLDFVGGRKDIERKIIRAIGNPHERIQEDRLRMIRAIRLSCRLNFEIEAVTADAILQHSTELFPCVAIERVCQELAKGLAFNKLFPMLIKLHDFNLLSVIFPTLQHISRTEIIERLKPINNYPLTIPLIGFLLPLFPTASLEEQIELCKNLKLSNCNQKFVLFLFHMRTLCFSKTNRPPELVDWVYCYANPLSHNALQILAAHLPENERFLFLQNHDIKIKTLAESISRVETQTPVVNAAALMKKGVLPGKTMGLLLNKANQIAINEQITDPNLVIAKLQNLDIWPK